MAIPSDHVDLRGLLDCIQEFIVVKDGSGRWLFCNETALAAYELSGFDYVGSKDEQLLILRPQFAAGFEYNIKTDALAWENRQSTLIEKSFMGQDGRINTWEVIKTPSFLSDGSRDRLVIVSRNITERKLAENALLESEERFKDLAHLDALTGIPNRRGILDLVSLGLSTSGSDTSKGCGSALLYLDLDRFKLINDQFGHEIGDELLVSFASKARQCLRDEDLLGRIGGDEFVVFLAATERDLAISIAKRLCESLCQPWNLRGHMINTSSSIGIALCPESGEDVHTLLRNADDALYQAKRAGRSQIKVHSAADGQVRQL